MTNSVEFLECVENKVFIETVYPSGLGEVLIGQFELDQGHFAINLHVYAEPSKQILKWGVWGLDYDVVVLKFLGDGLEDIEIDNWNGFGNAELSCAKQVGQFIIRQLGTDWNFKCSFSALVYQGGSTYLNGLGPGFIPR